MPYIHPMPMSKPEKEWILVMSSAGVPLLNVLHVAKVAA